LSSGTLNCLKKPGEQVQWSIDIDNAVSIGLVDKRGTRKFSFKLTVPKQLKPNPSNNSGNSVANEMYHLAAENELERDSWMKCLSVQTNPVSKKFNTA